MPNVNTVVLSEDREQQNLARRYLKHLSYDLRRVNFRSVPAGARSGEQHVRENYAKEVTAYRRVAARQKSALIVLVDADTGAIGQRAKQLSDELQNSQLAARGGSETIVHLIPRRNIETWILHLTGESVDENNIYKADTSQIEPAALRFYELTRANASIPDNCLPSLLAAIPEAQRLG